jgi:hypothetical protein
MKHQNNLGADTMTQSHHVFVVEVPYDDHNGDQQVVQCEVRYADPVVTIIGTVDARHVGAIERAALAAAVWDARQSERERGDDDGVEYGDPRDHRAGRE